MRFGTTLVFVVCIFFSSCGERPGIKPVIDDGGSPDADLEVDAIAAPSCWSLPNCIEGTTVVTGEELAYAGSGEPLRTEIHGTILEGPKLIGISLSVQLMPDAEAGTFPLSRDLFRSIWVDVHADSESCALIGEVSLWPVDTGPGGVTEGTFEGTAQDCTEQFHVWNGRFRLTQPEQL